MQSVIIVKSLKYLFMLDPAISFLEIYHKLIYEDIYKDLAEGYISALLIISKIWKLLDRLNGISI